MGNFWSCSCGPPQHSPGGGDQIFEALKPLLNQVPLMWLRALSQTFVTLSHKTEASLLRKLGPFCGSVAKELRLLLADRLLPAPRAWGKLAEPWRPGASAVTMTTADAWRSRAAGGRVERPGSPGPWRPQWHEAAGGAGGDRRDSLGGGPRRGAASAGRAGVPLTC